MLPYRLPNPNSVGSQRMSKSASPLRYPGGKAKLTELLHHVISENFAEKPIYIEPFAGGAGAALNLLFNNSVEKIIINDADVRIYSFWKSVLEQNETFINSIKSNEVNLQNWEKQRNIYLHPEDYSTLEVGFATFFLNRCNRSGILPNGGPIGGRSQTSKWKIDARFNKETLIDRITKIGMWRDKIEAENKDAIDLIKNLEISTPAVEKFYYIDPPYYKKGSRLYLNFYHHKDHEELSICIKKIKRSKWMLSYDNTDEIKKMYPEYRIQEYTLNYSANVTQSGKEVMISEPSLKVLEI